MGKPTRSAAELNEIITSYSEEYLDRKTTNQAFTNAPLFDHLYNRGRDVGGAYEIVVPITDNYTPTGGWFTRGATVNVIHTDPITQARYRWAWKQESAFLDWTDEQQAEGDGAMLNYVEEIIDNTLARFYEGLATDLVAATDPTNGWASLITGISDTGALGGLNPATAGQTFWKSYKNSTVGSFGSNGPTVLRAAFRETSKFKVLGKITGIFCSKTAFDEYEKSGLNLTTLMATGGAQQHADIGIDSLAYKTIPVEYEPHMDALEATLNGVMLGVNNKHLMIAKKPGQSMTMDPWVNMLPGNKVGRGSLVKGAFQTVWKARSPHFVLSGITV